MTRSQTIASTEVQIDVRFDPHCSHIHIAGRSDAQLQQALGSAVEAVLQIRPDRLIVDLTGLSTVDDTVRADLLRLRGVADRVDVRLEVIDTDDQSAGRGPTALTGAEPLTRRADHPPAR